MSNARKPNPLLCLVALLLVSQAHVVLAQQPATRWSRYLSAEERTMEYEKARFRATEKALAAMVDCVWVTPLVAQAMVSITVDKEKISAEEAEQRYLWLRQDCHFAIIMIDGLGNQFMKSQAQFFLAVGNKNVGIVGAVVKTPFAIPRLMSDGPGYPRYLVCFPRRAANGEATIPPNASRLRIAVQFHGGGAIIPIPVKQLIKVGAEL